MLHQMDITRTPAFSKAALPSGCGCDGKTEPEGQDTMCLGPPAFLYACAVFSSAPNHAGRSSQAMRALMPTHHVCLLGTISQPPLNAEFYSVAARSTNALEGDAKTPTPLAVIAQIVPP